MRRTILLFILSLVAASSNAAEFSIAPNGVGMEINGEIQKGDATKLANFILKDGGMNAFLKTVYLNSPGGDVREALKMSEILDIGFTQTIVSKGALCASACVYLWASGSVRYPIGNIGLHRLTTANPSFDVRKTEQATSKPSKDVDSYLLRMGMPRKILEKMNETSSSDLYLIDAAWLANEDLLNAVTYRPTFLDVSTKFCGPDPYATILSKGKKLNEETAQEWNECVEKIRQKNQDLYLKKILDTVFKYAGNSR